MNNMHEKICFTARNNGEIFSGYIMKDSIKEIMRSKSKNRQLIKFFGRFETKIDWNIIKDVPVIKDYIKRELPEYII